MPEFNWTPRIERDMETIAWILRRDNADTILLNKAYHSIETELRNLVQDVQTQTREDIRKEQNKK